MGSSRIRILKLKIGFDLGPNSPTKHVDFNVREDTTSQQVLTIISWEHKDKLQGLAPSQLALFRKTKNEEGSKAFEMLDVDFALSFYGLRSHELLLIRRKPQVLHVTCTKTLVVDFNENLETLFQDLVLPAFNIPTTAKSWRKNCGGYLIEKQVLSSNRLPILFRKAR
ncbi:hypothetical protein QOT17_008355 [Balamuthia mandrillaris]